MQEWKMRTREIAYLLNPAFCGRILIYHDSGVQRKVASGISISAGLFGFTLGLT